MWAERGSQCSSLTIYDEMWERLGRRVTSLAAALQIDVGLLDWRQANLRKAYKKRIAIGLINSEVRMDEETDLRIALIRRS